MKLFRTALSICLLFLLLLPVHAVSEAQATAGKTEALHALFTTADLMDATVAQLLDAMEDGRLTARRLVQMYLDRIEAYDKTLQLNSIISINPNALDEADAADAARAAGEPLGRLHGIPVIIKDNIDLEGMATTCGDIGRRWSIAYSDAEVVARLKQEGAIILAKANMALYAQSALHSYSTIAGNVGNAYDPERTPAGSSGGTAVAVTCNFAAVGLGTDTASSIRRPSSFANIYGLRPSHALVSEYGLYNLAASKDVIGPMCRSVEDLALVLDVIAGTDSKDYRTANADSYLPDGGYTASLNANGLEGKRIGYLANSFGYYYSIASGTALNYPTPLDDKIVGMVENAKATLVAGGAELVDLSDVLSEVTISILRYDESDSGRRKFRETINTILEENSIDAVLYISQTNVPERLNKVSDAPNNSADYLYTFGPRAGVPDLMLPMGLSETDEDTPYPLALGMSLFAGYGKDDVLIEIAYAYEQIADARVQPQTTPALPDADLAAFAETLKNDSRTLLNQVESAQTMQEALAALEGMTMLPVNDSDTRTIVDAVTYHDATAQLAAAYDALQAQIIAEAEAQEKRAAEAEKAAQEAAAKAAAEAAAAEAAAQQLQELTDTPAEASEKMDAAQILVVSFAASVPIAASIYTLLKRRKEEPEYTQEETSA